MRRLWFLVALLSGTPAFAAGWVEYVNARFGAAIDIPPDFIALPDSANGDGRSYASEDGRSGLFVWGSNLADDSFRRYTQSMLNTDREAGWEVRYEANKPGWHVYSAKMDDRVLYVRSIRACAGTIAISFRLEYPIDQKLQFDPVVERLSQSFHATNSLECAQ